MFMYYSIIAPFFLIFIFLMILLFVYLGVKISKWQSAKDPVISPGVQIIEGAVFALMGLLIAFTFSAANTKFDFRRHLIIEEANAIGTAYLRLDLVQPDLRRDLQDYFRQYLAGRLAVYEKLPDVEGAKLELVKTHVIQDKIWRLAMAGCKTSDQTASCIILLPALNSMFDIANTRYAIAGIHPPIIVSLLLIGVALISSLLSGYNLGNRNKGSLLFILSYTILMAATIYVIIDMEYPRLGLIRVDSFDQVLIDLQMALFGKV